MRRRPLIPRDEPMRLSDAAVAAWRLLRDEGGYWTAGEVGRRLGAGYACPAMAAVRWLNALRERGCVIALAPLGRGNCARYGVTRRCEVPLGQTLEPAPTLTLTLTNDPALTPGDLA